MGKGFCQVCGDKLPFDIHKKAAEEALDFVREKILSNLYDMIVMDEVNCAMQCKLLKVKDIVHLIKTKPRKLHLVLTGRDAPKSIIKVAELVSEVKEIKHPYTKGVLAQEGIEY